MMAKRLSGIWFKVVEMDGFYAGILMVPQEVAHGIESATCCRYAKCFDLTIKPAWLVTGANVQKIAPIDYIDFVSADGSMRDAIMVYGITMSDLNKERGFAFIPSAEYLLRGKPIPRITPPDNKIRLPEIEFNE